jgi:hypothetical protein
VDELGRARSLVADSGLEPDPAEPPKSLSSRHGAETVEGGIRNTSAISAPVIRSPRNAGDYPDAVLGGAIGHRVRRRGTISKPWLALTTEPLDPLARTAKTDAGGSAAAVRRPGTLSDALR